MCLIQKLLSLRLCFLGMGQKLSASLSDIYLQDFKLCDTQKARLHDPSLREETVIKTRPRDSPDVGTY